MGIAALTVGLLLVGSRLLRGNWPWQSELPAESPSYMDLFQQDGGQETYLQPEPVPDEVLRFLAGKDLESDDESDPAEWDYEPAEPYW